MNDWIKIQTSFIYKSTPAKIKNKTPILAHKQLSLKCTDVTFKYLVYIIRG